MEPVEFENSGYFSILEYLYDEKIFNIEKIGEKYIFSEACDEYFYVMLTQKDMKKLISELEELING